MRAVLENNAKSLVRDLQKSFKDKKLSATGRTARSIREEVSDSGFRITGPLHIEALVFGRGPSKRRGGSGSEPLWRALQKWARAKGININPYAAAKKIHKFGIKVPNRYNDGKVISDVINEKRVDEIASSILDFRTKQFTSQVIDKFNIKI